MRWNVSRGFLTHTHTHIYSQVQTHVHTDTVTNVFALLCCHNQDILNYHRCRLEAVSVFVAAPVRK